MKLQTLGIAVGVALGAMALQSSAAPLFADVGAVIDESGSMAGDQAWIKSMMPILDNKLINDHGLTPNQYSLVGFGGGGATNSGRMALNSGTAVQFSTTATGTGGSLEDGWAGINFALNNITWRAGTARNLILVTDEDRDNAGNALTYAGILGGLTSTSTLLNAVVDATFNCTGGGTGTVIGVGRNGVGYRVNGTGGYTVTSGCTAVSGFGTTIADYVNLALDSGGAAWNINVLRNGGNDATSFSAAFVDIKTAEIIRPPNQVPEPESLSLVALGLLGLLGLRRRIVKKA